MRAPLSADLRADALFETASAWQRAGALALDLAAAFLLFAPVMTVSAWLPRDGSDAWVTVGLLAVALLPAFWTVQSVRLGRRGQTLGMRRLGVWLVDARTGRPAGVVRAGLLRRALSLTYLLPGVGTLLLVADAFILARLNGRPLLDRLTGTVLLRTPPDP